MLNPEIFNFEYIGHLGYTLGVLSFLLKDILWLRSITVLSACLCIVYNYAGPATPMWVPIYWNSALVGINIIQIGIIFFERRAVTLNDQERWLYNNVFPNFSLVDFRKLMKTANWKCSGGGETLIVEGQQDSDLILISNGRCQVKFDDSPVAEVLEGEFVGEMSFLSKKAASATVSAVNDVNYVTWKRSDLDKLFNKAPSIQHAIKSAISNQLADKIIKTSKSKQLGV